MNSTDPHFDIPIDPVTGQPQWMESDLSTSDQLTQPDDLGIFDFQQLKAHGNLMEFDAVAIRAIVKVIDLDFKLGQVEVEITMDLADRTIYAEGQKPLFTCSFDQLRHLGPQHYEVLIDLANSNPADQAVSSYLNTAVSTESVPKQLIWMDESQMMDVVRTVSAVGQMLDAIKKIAFYGQPAEIKNLNRYASNVLGHVKTIRDWPMDAPLEQPVQDHYTIRMFHAVLGLGSETGEIAEILDGEYKTFDDRAGHVREEAGDVLWYLSVLLNANSLTFSETVRANADKLRKRYPKGKFDKQDAVTRADKNEERVCWEDVEISFSDEALGNVSIAKVAIEKYSKGELRVVKISENNVMTIAVSNAFAYPEGTLYDAVKRWVKHVVEQYTLELREASKHG